MNFWVQYGILLIALTIFGFTSRVGKFFFLDLIESFNIFWNGFNISEIRILNCRKFWWTSKLFTWKKEKETPRGECLTLSW